MDLRPVARDQPLEAIGHAGADVQNDLLLIGFPRQSIALHYLHHPAVHRQCAKHTL